MTAAAIRFQKPEISSPPEFKNVLKILRHEAPSRPTLFEFFLNGKLYAHLAGAEAPASIHTPDHVRWLLRAFQNAGYDYATYHGSAIHFPRGDHGVGGFRMAGGTRIQDRTSFDAYPWPTPDDFDYSTLAIDADLPQGMRLIVCGPGGVLENAVALVGYDTLCYLIADEPELVSDIFERIGSTLVRHYEIVSRYPAVGACISNDDWGFKTQPMLAPDQMRQYVHPWHQRIVETIHAAGKPAILHSCGNQESLYEDIIETLRYDGKHSYEDTIQPVEEAYEQYGARLAILGGIDLDFICRSTPQAVYERSRAMLDRSAARGSYGLGTGNSVPEYVPPENYFAMIAAAVENR